MTKPRILIVDDERNIQFLLAKALEIEEYTVNTVSTGKEALLKISGEHYDLIILDLRLPDIDGLEVLKEMDAVGNKLDVIMITAHGNIDVAVEAMKNGCVDFIQKPFDIDKFRELVDSILSRKNLAFQQTLKFESLIEVAKLETKERKYSKAIKLVQEALELDPRNSQAYNFLGVLYEILGDFQKAINAYQLSLRLDPHSENARANLERVRNLSPETGMIFG